MKVKQANKTSHGILRNRRKSALNISSQALPKTSMIMKPHDNFTIVNVQNGKLKSPNSILPVRSYEDKLNGTTLVFHHQYKKEGLKPSKTSLNVFNPLPQPKLYRAQTKQTFYKKQKKHEKNKSSIDSTFTRLQQYTQWSRHSKGEIDDISCLKVLENVQHHFKTHTPIKPKIQLPKKAWLVNTSGQTNLFASSSVGNDAQWDIIQAQNFVHKLPIQNRFRKLNRLTQYIPQYTDNSTFIDNNNQTFENLYSKASKILGVEDVLKRLETFNQQLKHQNDKRFFALQKCLKPIAIVWEELRKSYLDLTAARELILRVLLER